MKRIRTVSPTKTNPRGGTSLVEVLMAILCMGIGVVAVASLFPIALLRSVQATQLTSGTILRFNAETLIDLYDEIPTTAQPNAYRNLILNPDFDTNAMSAFFSHFGDHYLIDPLGAMIVRGDNKLPLDQLGSQTDHVGRLPRFDSLRIFYNTPTYGTPLTAQQEAEDIVTLPDSWVTFEEFDEFPDQMAMMNNMAPDTSIILPANTEVDYAELINIINGGGAVRIVLFNKNGRMSEVRNLTAAGIDQPNNTINWTPALPDNDQYFPSANPGSEPGAVSRVRFEFKERRYTWLLTVRNDTPASAQDAAVARARVDVVIFFRRAPSLEEEIPYLVTGSGRNYTVSKISQNDWTAAYPPTMANPDPNRYPDPYPDPFLKKGGFMLDTDTGTWHRLQKINDNTQTITLERNTQTLNGDHVVFMKGVVDVYPLGSKP